jgi:hypothetical protein
MSPRTPVADSPPPVDAPLPIEAAMAGHSRRDLIVPRRRREVARSDPARRPDVCRPQPPEIDL